LIGKHSGSPKKSHPLFTATTKSMSNQEIQQEMAYRTVRMAVIDEMMGDGFTQMVDSAFIVHNNLLHRKNNRNDDARFFRCDIFGEVLQWNAPNTANAAIEFIMGLHDMWSRIMVEKTGSKPWWIGDDVTTIQSGNGYHSTIDGNDLEISFGDEQKRRRLQEEEGDIDASILTKEGHLQKLRRLLAEFGDTRGVEVSGEEAVAEEDPDDDSGDDDDSPDDAQDEEDETVTTTGEHNGFGVVQEAIQAVFGGISGNKKLQQESKESKQVKQKKVERFAQPLEGPGENGAAIDDFVVNDDDTTTSANNNVDDDDDSVNKKSGQTRQAEKKIRRSRRSPHGRHEDPSSYDVWMGILSSTNVKYFSRIVSMQAVGAYRVNHYDTPNSEL
jgi:hypothetical protein